MVSVQFQNSYVCETLFTGHMFCALYSLHSPRAPFFLALNPVPVLPLTYRTIWHWCSCGQCILFSLVP